MENYMDIGVVDDATLLAVHIDYKGLFGIHNNGLNNGGGISVYSEHHGYNVHEWVADEMDVIGRPEAKDHDEDETEDCDEDEWLSDDDLPVGLEVEEGFMYC
ncbi:hypothetical protein L2E82_06999 [Cichorium intybus]|uniref:Uncharacterized protein n=1 Tax=Cichorium intybus TaxID=13427 RepID=A0ACB9G4B1_CICIN|nr:hypothetical protein L2E82_06999 [Cichorium intybus]